MCVINKNQISWCGCDMLQLLAPSGLTNLFHLPTPLKNSSILDCEPAPMGVCIMLQKTFDVASNTPEEVVHDH